MPAFIPRVYQEILDEEKSLVRATTRISDFNDGGVTQTTIETVAFETDELNYQLFLIRSAFSILTASGAALDARVAEFGVRRFGANPSAGFVQFTYGPATSSTIVGFGVLVPAVSDYLTLENSAGFPVAPFSVRVGEGTENDEILSVVDNDTPTGVLTISPVAGNPHLAEESVVLVSGQDQVIQSGIKLSSQSSSLAPNVQFITTGTGIVISGSKLSSLVSTVAVASGVVTNIGAGQITEFSGTPPIGITAVTNPSSFFSGSDSETDEKLRQRALNSIQNLSRGTRQVIETELLGKVDPDTSQRVTSLKLLETPITNDALAYVDDGSGTAAISNLMAQNFMNGIVAPLAVAAVLDSVSTFPSFGSVLISPEDSTQTEVLDYEVLENTLSISLSPATAKTHDDNDEVLTVDVLVDSAELGQRRLRTQHLAIIPGTLRVWGKTSPAGLYSEWFDGVQFKYNSGNGELLIISPVNGLPIGSKVVAHYSYYTGLLATAQKLIDGVESDPQTYPGLKAVGTKIIATAPGRKTVPIAVSITAVRGFREEDLAELVKTEIYNYVNALGVGENIILSEIIQRVKSILVNGAEAIDDVVILSPTSNVIVLESERANISRDDISVT